MKVDASTEDGKIRTEVSVKREQQLFTRSGPEIADEVILYYTILYYNVCVSYNKIIIC